MALVLRVDVDKPYGRTTLRDKILSKLREDYWFPAISSLGYLNYLRIFLDFLSEEEIKAHIYFRKCTLPPKRWLAGSLLNGHKLGLHAEDTRSFETFKKELEEVQAHFNPKRLSSFTKHGSGKWKGGRHHYPLYEPDKYLKWAETIGISFLFGNAEKISEPEESSGQNQFYPGMFWIERYRSNECERFTLQRVINIAKNKNVIVIIHPEHFIDIKRVENDMKKLVSLARQHNVSWITL